MVNLEVIFWDVGQGDASSIMLSDGSYILIDTGPNAKRGNPLPRWFAEHPDARIKKVVITHTHRDHFGGLISLLEGNCGIDEIIMVKDSAFYGNKQTLDFKALRQVIEHKVQSGLVKLTLLQSAPYEVINQDGFRLLIARPSSLPSPVVADQNATSMVIWLERLDAPNHPIIVWGGDALLSDMRKCLPPIHPNIIMGPHHGQPQDKFESGEKWKKTLKDISPDCLFVSVGSDNQYKHPKRHFLLAANQLGSKICCSEITERCGIYRRTHDDVYPGNMMLGILKPPSAVECRGSMRVEVSLEKGVLFDDCQAEFEEAVKAIENRPCK